MRSGGGSLLSVPSSFQRPRRCGDDLGGQQHSHRMLGSLQLPCGHVHLPSAISLGVCLIICDFKTRFRISQKGVLAEWSRESLVESDEFQAQLCHRVAQGRTPGAIDLSYFISSVSLAIEEETAPSTSRSRWASMRRALSMVPRMVGTRLCRGTKIPRASKNQCQSIPAPEKPESQCDVSRRHSESCHLKLGRGFLPLWKATPSRRVPFGHGRSWGRSPWGSMVHGPGRYGGRQLIPLPVRGLRE